MSVVQTLQEIEWEPCLVEPRRDRELERDIKREMGSTPHEYAYFAPIPWIVRSLVAFNPNRLPLVHTDFDLADLIALIVSQDNSCRYCYAASRALLKILGLPEYRIRKLEENLMTAELDARDKLALDFVRRVSRSNPLPTAADRARLEEAGYGPRAVTELAFLTIVNLYFNRLSTLPALPAEAMERLPNAWYVKLARPLLAWSVRSKRLRGHPQPLTPELRRGPFSWAVVALDGLPVAALLRRVLDEAWRSEVLAPRAKSLVFAVIARGLGCRRSESEARHLATEHGLCEADFEEVLSHLASAKLDPIESAIVPFARETIWYQPAQIQRHGRAVLQQLGIRPFLEVVGIASLANAVCRLAAVVDDG